MDRYSLWFFRYKSTWFNSALLTHLPTTVEVHHIIRLITTLLHVDIARFRHGKQPVDVSRSEFINIT